MSVSFIVDAEIPRVSKREPCLCAQDAPAWRELYLWHGTGPLPFILHVQQSRKWASLAEHANPSCAQCQGTGVEQVELDQRPQVNFANENAAIVARALGIDLDGGIGSMELATLRRGLIRARNVTMPEIFREGVETERLIVASYDRSDLARALARFDELVTAAEGLGATRIFWQ